MKNKSLWDCTYYLFGYIILGIIIVFSVPLFFGIFEVSKDFPLKFCLIFYVFAIILITIGYIKKI